MKQIKWISYIVVVIIFGSCIKPFDPKIDANAVNKYVIDGGVNSIEGWQTIKVSKASSVDDAKHIPVSNCEITILDDLGQSFNLTENEDGEYRVWMNNADLVPGNSYMVKIVTPEGDIIESGFDQMPEGPQVGDVYFEITDIPTNDPDYSIHGIQIYTDLVADQMDSRFYRWKLTETWEYHSEYPREHYYDAEGIHQISPPDSSKMYCWRTMIENDIFTLSTTNLSENAQARIPLNYVKNTNAKLMVLYSLLVEQSALSDDAYNYWDKLRVNISQEGGLYTSQPLSIKGNLRNSTHPEKEVLGFFQAVTLSTKRIFIYPIDELELDVDSPCLIYTLRFGLMEITENEFPANVYFVGGAFMGMTIECVDCESQGGVTIKPDYWPN